MYRLLIVDDEDQIVDWLYDLFKSDGMLDLDVYKAYSGFEAVQWMEKLKIDILLTDMRMPGMDGMALLDQAKTYWPACKIIFLSAHNEFDYIYQTSKHKGVSYLLKSEHDSVIVQAVQKAISDLDAELIQDSIAGRVKELEKKALPFLQEEFLSDVFDGLIDEISVFRQKFEELDIKLNPEQPVLMVMGKIDNRASFHKPLERSKLFISVKLIAEKFLTDEMPYVVSINEKLYIVWLIQEAVTVINPTNADELNADWPKMVNSLKWSFESIQMSFKESMGLTMSFAISGGPCSFIEVKNAYASLKRQLNLRIGPGTEMIVTTDLGLLESDSTDGVDNEVEKICTQLKKVSQMINLMENGTRDEYMSMLGSMVECLRKVKSMNYSPALEIYYSVSVQLLSHINRWNLKKKLLEKVGVMKLLMHNEFSSWNEAVDYLYHISNALFEMQAQEQVLRTNDTISKIKRYIKANISGELSLYHLGEVVHFNPVYLSQLFKQVTGNNLSDYIIHERMKTAKVLLLKSEMKIYEVASSVGYGSANYFVRFFKKEMGVTPQEFRNQDQSDIQTFND